MFYCTGILREYERRLCFNLWEKAIVSIPLEIEYVEHSIYQLHAAIISRNVISPHFMPISLASLCAKSIFVQDASQNVQFCRVIASIKKSYLAKLLHGFIQRPISQVYWVCEYVRSGVSKAASLALSLFRTGQCFISEWSTNQYCLSYYPRDASLSLTLKCLLLPCICL